MQLIVSWSLEIIVYTARFYYHSNFIYIYIYTHTHTHTHTHTNGDSNVTYKELYIWTVKYYIYILPDIGLGVRVFANGPGDLGSIPGRVIPKTQKMVLDASLLSTQHYKVRIKGKVEQSRKGVAPSPTHWCSSYRKGSLRVTLDYGRQLYLYIYIYTHTHMEKRKINYHIHRHYIYIYIYISSHADCTEFSD